ncbi:uncharacterized protein [Venturia canescens]|uniref:uncharacterized protein n=1 Tax=Venturia canescens TaxID=32260 RepID=UPI001C9CFBEA|nr:uncharacterized protein LOC122416412 [Venturia canescens]
MLNRKFGSKSLLNILSSLGFCCSYDDSLLFEASILMEPSNASIASDSFSQFVFDNADHNINTIDGLHTFHAMCGIECVTPASAVSCGSSIPKLKKLPSAETIGKFGAIAIKNFDGYRKSGLENVLVENLNLKNPTVRYEFDIKSADFLWLYNYKTSCTDVQGWNGFMENVNKDKQYVISRIVCLPFLNSPPGNYDTIYTVLNLAAERMKSKNQNIAFVTFDQPLYMKAMEIMHCSDDPNLKNVVIRLGGFHLLISFLGAIGNIMDGSGLKELFSEIYAPASVDKMLAGHAYSRAVRAHTLSLCALAQIILSFTDFSEQDILKLTALLQNPHTVLESIKKDSQFNNIKNNFIATVEKLSKNSGTAKLWTQYFHMVTLVKMFIEAERSGNWQLHLETVQKILPYFHSSGHHLYAKSAHLYLQNMYNLSEKMDKAEYEQFVEGCFTIRRTDKFWSGIWSDMTIEQFLMRSMKDIGGPTRSLSDSVLSKWVLTTPALVYLTESITEFCNVFLASTEQHIDARPTRISRDNADVKKLTDWFDNHNPFPHMEGIISLSSGLKGDSKINCHEALEIGLTCLENTWRITDDQCPKTFKDIKFKKINKILSLKSLVSLVKVADRTVTIDPSLLFQRICVLQKTESELKSYFNHELVPYPLSLFDDNGMRKTPKSKLYNFFTPVEPQVKAPNNAYVIDGGFLLHKIVWQSTEIFKDILDRYVNYLVNNYSPNCIVVFDGYPEKADEMFTKSAERQRRTRANCAPEVKFDLHMPSTLTQDKFLSNEKNKSHLIYMLSEKLRNVGFGVKQAQEDADYLIVETAISISDQYHSVFIVGEDIDLLVILTQNADSKKKPILH